MDQQKLMSYMRKAIDTYNMIEEGDKIAVGISGGKDSLTLLLGMKGLQRFYPKKFDLIAISVDIGIPGFDTTEISKLCEEHDIEYIVEKTDIYDVVFNYRKETNPCSLCSKLRKGALNDKIKELGCNKLCYGHHKDDIIETYFMSLLYEGRINTFAPVTYLDRSELTLIRPMIYCNEKDVISFSRKYSLPIVKVKCPNDGYSKREYAKELVARLEVENPKCRNRIFAAIENSTIKGWKNE